MSKKSYSKKKRHVLGKKGHFGKDPVKGLLNAKDPLSFHPGLRPHQALIGKAGIVAQGPAGFRRRYQNNALLGLGVVDRVFDTPLIDL